MLKNFPQTKNRLREVRFLKRLRQIDVQQMSGIGVSRISVIETEDAEPREHEKVKIAQALKMKVEEIFPT